MVKMTGIRNSRKNCPRLSRDVLVRVRLRAVRKGAWFRVLSRLERGLLDLTLKVTDKIRSRTLAEAVGSVVKKLLGALESKVDRLIREVGVPLAEKISKIARRWGNKNAHKWAENKAFIQYLTIVRMNDPG